MIKYSLRRYLVLVKNALKRGARRLKSKQLALTLQSSNAFLTALEQAGELFAAMIVQRQEKNVMALTWGGRIALLFLEDLRAEFLRVTLQNKKIINVHLILLYARASPRQSAS